MSNMKVGVELEAKTKEAAAAVRDFNREVDGMGKTAESSSKKSTTASKSQISAMRDVSREAGRQAEAFERSSKTQKKDIDGLVARLVQMRAEVVKTGPLWTVMGQRASSAIGSIKSQIFSIQGALAGLGVVGIASDFLNTAAAFENLELSLETLSGSSQLAKQNMVWISDFTASTPYELQDVAEAFRQLSAYGIEPTKYLRILGDTSASMSKELIDAVEAFSDATTGEYERLKSFGIKASTAGDQVTFSWTKNGQAMQQTVEKTGTAVAAALSQIWSDRYSGGMERLSKGWTGLWSNLKDQITQFERDVMVEGGVLDYLKEELGGLLDTLSAKAKDGSLKELARQLGEDVKGALKSLLETAQELNELRNSIPEGAGGTLFLGFLARFFGASGPVVAEIMAVDAALKGLSAVAQNKADITWLEELDRGLQPLKDWLNSGNISDVQAGLAQAQAAAAAEAAAEEARLQAERVAQAKEAAEKAASAEGVSAAKIKDIQADLSKFRAVEWDKVIKTIKSKLKEAEAEEEKYAAKVKALQEERDQAGQNTQDKARALMRTQMSDYDAYRDRIAEANEAMNKARLALTGGDGELAETWAKKAQEQFYALNGEVKDGERVLVSAAEAYAIALNGVTESGQVLDQAILQQEKAAEAQRKEAAATVAQYKQDLESIKTMQDAVKELEMTLSADDQASPVLDEIKDRLDGIQDKTVTITTKYVEEGSPSSGSGSAASSASSETSSSYGGTTWYDAPSSYGYKDGGWPGTVSLAGGGDWKRLLGRVHGPGTTTSDSVRAMLSVDEFVVRARAQQAGSAVVPGFWDAANAVSTPKEFAHLISAVSANFRAPQIRMADGGGVADALAGALPMGSHDTMTVAFQVGGKEYPVEVAKRSKPMLVGVLDELDVARRMAGI